MSETTEFETPGCPYHQHQPENYKTRILIHFSTPYLLAGVFVFLVVGVEKRLDVLWVIQRKGIQAQRVRAIRSCELTLHDVFEVSTKRSAAEVIGQLRQPLHIFDVAPQYLRATVLQGHS